ncbi:unnamed protein product [Ambrosiozyma monospora]|uniref:Unnamed protein product n=1 Tax=Ambrosiozyma monospora TaxID=43982 RepID=A0ACB5TCK8_AMBMO|nr:unnamed protein product [Ambrosiozyma monospora]
MAKGWNGSIMSNESLMLIFDAMMVFLALVFISVFYPGLSFMKKRLIDEGVIGSDVDGLAVSIIFQSKEKGLKFEKPRKSDELTES